MLVGKDLRLFSLCKLLQVSISPGEKIELCKEKCSRFYLPIQHEVDEVTEQFLEEYRKDKCKRKLILREGKITSSFFFFKVEPTLRGVTTDQRIADSRRERSQKKAERMRMIT